MSSSKLQKEIENLSKQARSASYKLATLSLEQRNKALGEIASLLNKNRAQILEENKNDIKTAKKNRLSAAFTDRLTLTDKYIDSMIDGVKQIIDLDDPLNRILEERTLKNGLLLKKVSVPLGVILMIFESRPNVTIDAASLCLKSGNAVILRGGSDALYSNKILAGIIKTALEKIRIHKDSVQLVSTTDREAVNLLLEQEKYIDVVIPRGGYGLIKAIAEHSKIPVIKHYQGICHTYVDDEADLKLAEEVCFNAKCSRPAVCNAMECLVVNEKIADKFLPSMIRRYISAGVKIFGDEKTLAVAENYNKINNKINTADELVVERAKQDHYDTEFLDLIIAVKVVDSLQEAIDFINTHSTKHSEAIISKNQKSIKQFMDNIDASAVFANTSTRFNDGFEFGLGAEIGISTDKLHARGPVGLKELTTYKYLVFGDGQIRA
ncbi:glutamate-5-semialdehyde dehydrogenase [Candidatus Woesearchaeota archaeon]|nr:glutamate-5-semialdehyde dehydrogenase [Candidatus Woesearchaeota archaeon]